MTCYIAYGLRLKSALSFPELPIDKLIAEADVIIRFDALEHLSDQVDEWGFCFRLVPGGVYLFWKEIGAFLVRDGREVIISSLPFVEDRVLRLPLLGVISAILLHQRGFLVLHASAIAVNGQAVAFVGEKGQGKSTTAVTLYNRGHLLIADDVVAIDMQNPQTPYVVPGFPQFKLWSDTVSSILGDEPETLPQLHPKLDKRSHRISERFSDSPVPLKQVYVLTGGTSLSSQLLSSQDAMVQLITHSYISRFDDQLLQGEAGFTHFHQCASLINHIPICFLERPRSLSLLDEVAHLVESNLVTKTRLTS